MRVSLSLTYPPILTYSYRPPQHTLLPSFLTPIIVESRVRDVDEVVDVGEVDAVVEGVCDGDVAQMRNEVGASQRSARYVNAHRDQLAWMNELMMEGRNE